MFSIISTASSHMIDVTLALFRAASHTDWSFISYLVWMYHIIDSWTLNSRSTAQLTPEQSLSDAHIFSIRHITDFSRLGTLDSTSTLLLLAISNSKIANKKHTSVKKCGFKQTTKWPPIYSMRSETRRQSITFFYLI